MFLDCFLALKLCSNAILSVDLEYGKSPCFLRYARLGFANVDRAGPCSRSLDVDGFGW